jgi:hypothetical protein
VAQIFPKWSNIVPGLLLIAVLLSGISIIGFFWYYGSPNYTDVGYRPQQPIPYSHKLHAGDLGIDCCYCHTSVETSAKANVPPTQTCMNCHNLILAESEKILPIRESYVADKPIEWVRVHKIADYAYFNHSAHINAGIGCISCHGNVAEMEKVMQVEPLSMGWCLDCHRNPNPHLRPLEEITNMKWTPPDNQLEFAARLRKEKKIEPPEDCSGCHR